MKKTTTILCLGIALCMLGCSDDDDQVTTTSTVPFSLTASLSPRSSDAEDTGILQGNWDANSQLAVIKTGSSGVPKSILTRKTDSSDTFTGNLSTLVKNENEYIPLLEHTTCIKRWDISPELRGAHDFAKYTRSKGIMTAVTHTEAEYDEIKAAHAVGFSHAAHFYNAMPGFHKRREYKYEGTVESVYLTDGMTVEVIADGIHLPATILKLVYKLKGVENTCLVTDALAYAAYEGHEPIDPRYIIEDGVCKMADHSALAGSLATMDVLVRTMVKKANIPLEDAVRMASETPARLIGVSDRKGALAKGLDADIVILDKELNVRCVWSMGKIVPGTDVLLHK